MSTRFFTNDAENTLLKKFAGVFEHNPDIDRFDALVGYLRASGYFALRPHLEKVPKIRILVGINVDAIMADYHRRGLLLLADPTRALEEFKFELRRDIQSSPYSPEVENGVLQFVEDVLSRKIELRAHPTKRLHAKLYIFLPRGWNEHKPGAVITGSSNLTNAGLGSGTNASNYECNVVLHDYADVKFAKDEFDELWEQSVEKGRYFRGSSESLLDQDLSTLRQGGGADELLERLRNQVGRLDIVPEELEGRNQRSALFKTMFLAFRQAGAKDWKSNLAIALDHSGIQHRLQFHHIFPKAYLKKAYRGREADDIANLAFIGGRTNRNISAKPPADYLQAIIARDGTAPFDAQRIPVDSHLLTIENYKQFLTKRREMITDALNKFLGQPTVG